MENIKELKEKREELMVELENTLKSLEEDRSAETKETFNTLELEIEEIDKKIASMEIEQVEEEEIKPEKIENIIKEKEDMEKTTNEILRETIYGNDVSNTPNKKILLPTTVESKIVQKRHEGSVLRKHATIMSASGNTILPVEKGLATAAFGSEIGEVIDNTPTFGAINFEAIRCGSLVKVSEDALKDSAFDLEAEIASQISRAYATIENTKFVNGTGTGEPEGFLNNADVGAYSTSLVWDDIENLYFSLKAPYRQNAVWMMNSKTLKLVKGKMTDDGTQNAPVREILGRPVEIVETMPDFASGNKAIAFGDFAYYKIMDRQGVELRTLDEIYAVNGIVGFLANARLDAHLTLPEAVKVLVHGSAPAGDGGTTPPATDGDGDGGADGGADAGTDGGDGGSDGGLG